MAEDGVRSREIVCGCTKNPSSPCVFLGGLGFATRFFSCHLRDCGFDGSAAITNSISALGPKLHNLGWAVKGVLKQIMVGQLPSHCLCQQLQGVEGEMQLQSHAVSGVWQSPPRTTLKGHQSTSLAWQNQVVSPVVHLAFPVEKWNQATAWLCQWPWDTAQVREKGWMQTDVAKGHCLILKAKQLQPANIVNWWPLLITQDAKNEEWREGCISPSPPCSRRPKQCHGSTVPQICIHPVLLHSDLHVILYPHMNPGVSARVKKKYRRPTL